MYNTHSKTRPSERLMFQTALFYGGLPSLFMMIYLN